MAFDLAQFERRGVELPKLYPAAEQAGFAFGENDTLPDPMDLVRKGALVVASHSGGKDGQAMLVHLVERLKVPTSQIVCIHADLGEAEWEGTADHARANAEAYGIPFLVCKAQDKKGNSKDLLDYVDKRGQFMSSTARFCTSDWKRSPIRRTINAYREEIGHTSPYVLNCMGLRSEESSARAKLEPLQFVKSASCPPKPYPDVLEAETRATRRVFFDWHPIHHFSEDQVFATIAAGGQQPHWAYTKAGAKRLSCTVCIYSSESCVRAAVTHSGKARNYARRVIALEEKHNHTILPLKPMGKGQPPVKRWLKDIVGDLLDEAA